MDSMKELWARLEGRVPQGLAPGATDEEIRSAEERIGVRLAVDLRASYRLHNGGPMPFVAGRDWDVWEALTLDQLVGLHEGLMECRETGCEHEAGLEDCGCEWHRRNGHPVRQGNSWYRGWLPVVDGGDSSYTVVDMSPLADGTVGQVIAVDCAGPAPEVIAGSWRAYVQGVADGLDALGA
ncbi:SMI1/KNR4 family protein [Streptomyces sp. HUAS TT7]|uniref:SMI1/KNR4 family protein n=1 Tax=Streptomyces sp. HUAS TT7 TaxID=3447507 RepID=UPI003F656684